MKARHFAEETANLPPEETTLDTPAPGGASDDRAFRLTDAGNTLNSALVVIRSKGYQIYYQAHADEDRPGHYWAIKGKRDFISTDPVALLGLIAIWEHFGDNWYHIPEPKIYDEILDIAFPEDEYDELDDAAFAERVSHLRPFFKAIFQPLPENITRQELAHWMNTYYEDNGEEADQDETDEA